MISTPDGYSYAGHKRGKFTIRPFCHAAGNPAVLVEGPGTALILNIEHVEAFVHDLRTVAASTRRNHAVTRRPRTPKGAE